MLEYSSMLIEFKTKLNNLNQGLKPIIDYV